MVRRLQSLRASLDFVIQRASHMSMGGSWALSHPTSVQTNLRNFWFDGLFASAHDAIILNYLILYILALGASSAQIGIMSSLSSLSATLLLLPGAILVEKFGHRKWIAFFSGGITARLILLLLIFVPFLGGGSSLVYMAMAFSIARDAFANLGLPAWIALTSDMIPIAWRGRYFASRNIIMSAASIVITIAAGQMITRIGQPLGYQVALGFAFIFGIISAYFFSNLKEPEPVIGATTPLSFSPRALFGLLLKQGVFLNLCLVAALWNFSLNIAGPFFTVYMSKSLLLTPAIIGFVGIFSNLSGLPSQRILGPLTDRLGPRQVQMALGFLIPLLPLAWVFIKVPWQIAAINILGGFLWAGYSLAAFNLLLELTPDDQRARASAIYQIIVSIALAAGAALGGVIVSQLGFKAVFLLSAIGRWVAAFLFARVVKNPIPASAS
jgi:MFS family permease